MRPHEDGQRTLYADLGADTYTAMETIVDSAGHHARRNGVRPHRGRTPQTPAPATGA